MRKIFTAIPAYSGEICVQTMHSLFFAREEAAGLGWEFAPDRICTRCHDADIAMVRNAFLGWFLKTDCTDLFYVDADIVFGPGTFSHLFSHGVDFVAGAYRKKRENEEYTILWPEKKTLITDEISGKPLIEVEGVGFGLVRLSRALVQKVFEESKEHFMDVLGGAPDVECPWIFENAPFDGLRGRSSEDYTFCRRWREMGGKVYIDPSICVDHIGKKTYQGDLTAYLGRQVQEHQAMQYERLTQEDRTRLMAGQLRLVAGG